ncbi:MAG: AarF/UbiB family protein [Desulfobacterales bacterium]
MISQNTVRSIPAILSFGMNSAKRVRQATTVLARTGLDWILEDHPSAPVLLRKAFERMGATYIKLGQLIASSPSLFPEKYVKEFQKCLDRTDPVPFRHMKRILKKELGRRNIKKIFSHIDPEPLASASIAQVYAARLVTGQDVVIKIQRPGVKDILTMDLNFLLAAANIIEFIVPGLKHASITGVVSEIRRTVKEECNFIKEAENIKIFSDFLKSTGNTNVITPRVYHRASTRRVLTMERLHGIPLNDRDQLMKSADQPHRILGAAFKTWMESVTKCELFHADLHAGNLLILADGRVGFIDFGIVGRISEKTKEGVRSLIKALIMIDHASLAESMAMIGMTRKKVNTDLLAKDLENLYNDIHHTQVDLPDPDQVLLEMVGTAEDHGIRFPREFTLLIKQFLYFDSYRDLLFNMDFLMDEMMGKLDRLNHELGSTKGTL